MLRRLAPLVLALCCAPAAFADLAPWDQPAPATGAAPDGASVAAPSADLAGVAELLALVLEPALAKKLKGATDAQRAAVVSSIWNEDLKSMKADQRARLQYAFEHLSEAGHFATPRALTLLVLGAPEAVHSEPARAWNEPAAEKLEDLEVLRARLRSGKADAGAATMPLNGTFPTEIWVYPGATINELRTVVFVDEDGDGTFRFAKDVVVPAGAPISSAPGREMPSTLFPPVEIAGTIEPLPTLTKSGLPIRLSQEFFKASAGRTFTRFLLVVDPSDVELELGGDPAVFSASATAWLRVEQAGNPVWQGNATLASLQATASTPWLAELSVPLPPGTYQATALVLDAQGAGGSTTSEVIVPAYGGKLSVSSPVVARVGAEGLPRAAAAEAEGLLPFQVGNYIVRPALGGTFRRGDSVAFVLQAYDAPAATITYRLQRDGVFQSELDPIEIKSLPATQIQVVDIAPAFTDGSYEMRVTVTNASDPSEKVVVSMPFRVRG